MAVSFSDGSLLGPPDKLSKPPTNSSCLYRWLHRNRSGQTKPKLSNAREEWMTVTAAGYRALITLSGTQPLDTFPHRERTNEHSRGFQCRLIGVECARYPFQHVVCGNQRKQIGWRNCAPYVAHSGSKSARGDDDDDDSLGACMPPRIWWLVYRCVASARVALPLAVSVCVCLHVMTSLIPFVIRTWPTTTEKKNGTKLRYGMLPRLAHWILTIHKAVSIGVNISPFYMQQLWFHLAPLFSYPVHQVHGGFISDPTRKRAQDAAHTRDRAAYEQIYLNCLQLTPFICITLWQISGRDTSAKRVNTLPVGACSRRLGKKEE